MVIVGESADLIFGGMDKLISPKWDYEGFAKRYTFLEPELVLKEPVSQYELFEKYRRGNTGIDYMRFMDEVFSVESSGSYWNAFSVAQLPYYDPMRGSRWPSRWIWSACAAASRNIWCAASMP